MTIPIQLESHYRERGIYPATGPDFKCKHVADCRDEMPFTPLDATLSSPWRDTFTPGHSAMVGEYYEKASPRILFVALDLGTVLLDEDRDYSYVRPESRGPAAVRKNHERMVSLVLAGKSRARRPTLRRTNQLAEALLCGLPGIPEKPGGDFMRFCARANAVKCCMNRANRAQAHKRLYENCREYLREEIEILAPDIIVSQGEMVKEAMEFAFSTSSEWAQEQTVTLRNGKKAAWFPSYHPSSFGPYKKQEERRNQFVHQVRERFWR